MLEIRPEQPSDADGIRALNRSAFDSQAEAKLVDLLCERGRNIVSLVAIDGEQVIGQVLFTEVHVTPAAPYKGVGLAPLAVLPDYYPRFGFKKASDYGLDNDYNADDAYMALEFKPGVLGTFKGVVHYVPEFEEVGC
jgi:putative acetyltransferase